MSITNLHIELPVRSASPIRRRPGGAIDVDYYLSIARRLRSRTLRLAVAAVFTRARRHVGRITSALRRAAGQLARPAADHRATR